LTLTSVSRVNTDLMYELKRERTDFSGVNYFLENKNQGISERIFTEVSNEFPHNSGTSQKYDSQ
ncbi:hypothetical protein STEG23_010786, partial [Scotinomys teguina]